MLIVCVPILGVFGAPLQRWHERSFVLKTGLVIFLLLILWCAALINLIKDVDRGYSPDKCSLAAVILLILLFALAPLLFIGYQVLWAAAHLK